MDHNETVDQALADEAAEVAAEETKVAALTVEEKREHDFLATLSDQRGGVLAPDQQARFDDLKARQAAAVQAVDAATAALAEVTPAEVPEQTAGDGNATGAAPVVEMAPAPAPVDATPAATGDDGAMTGDGTTPEPDATEPAPNEA